MPSTSTTTPSESSHNNRIHIQSETVLVHIKSDQYINERTAMNRFLWIVIFCIMVLHMSSEGIFVYIHSWNMLNVLFLVYPVTHHVPVIYILHFVQIMLPLKYCESRNGEQESIDNSSSKWRFEWGCRWYIAQWPMTNGIVLYRCSLSHRETDSIFLAQSLSVNMLWIDCDAKWRWFPRPISVILMYILSRFVLTLSLCLNTKIVLSLTAGIINVDPISIYEGNHESNGNLEADFNYVGDTVKHIAADCRVSPGNLHCEWMK